MIIYFLKSAIRNLLHNKVYASISIIGFAISFTICIVIALYLKYEYSYDQCFENHERIYRVINRTDDRNESRFDYNANHLFEEKIPEIESACPLFMHIGWKNTVKHGDNTIYFDELLCTTNSFFTIFSINNTEGFPARFPNDPNYVVITKSIANQLFPNGNANGKIIKLMDEYMLTIAAVIPDFSDHSTFRGQIIMNSQNPEYRFSRNCNNGECYNPSNHFILLDKNNNIAAAETKINAMLGKEKIRVEKVAMQPLTNIYLNKEIIDNHHSEGNIVFISLLIVIGILILIIAVINYVNFTNSLQFSRLRMIGIQKSLGAKRKELFLYQFTEVLLWIFTSTILALGIAHFGMPLFRNLFGANLSFASILSPAILLSIILVFILVVSVASISPIFILFKGRVAGLLKNTLSKSGKTAGKTVLTSFQLVISIVLVIGIMMIQKQIRYVKHKDLGFDKELLLLVNTPYYFTKNEVLKSELLKHSNIKSLSFTRGGPGNINCSMGNGLDDNYFDLKCISVDTTFLKTFGIELSQGRKFMPSDFDRTCIINKEAYKNYGWDDLENKRFMNGRKGGYEVIGVVEDFHIASLYKRIEPVCLIYDVKETSFVNMRLAGGDLSATMDYIEKTWNEITGNLPFEYKFYDALFDTMYKKEEALAKNVSLFAFIALILTILGIFGQIFHVSIIKTKEIGIRKVNGARIVEILALLNNDFVKSVCIAFIIATPIVWYLIGQWLSSFSYKTTMDWWIFALGGTIVLLITMITVSWQSWRTATRNPVEALRYE